MVLRLSSGAGAARDPQVAPSYLVGYQSCTTKMFCRAALYTCESSVTTFNAVDVFDARHRRY
jgi:hypothetical protein